MIIDFLDHRLPLVVLKEQRHDLIVALLGRQGPIAKATIAEIANIQHAITAIEAVIVELDAELGIVAPSEEIHIHARH
jgi:hypothetical protein